MSCNKKSGNYSLRTPGINYKNLDIHYRYRTVKEIIPRGRGMCLDLGARNSNLKQFIEDLDYDYIGIDIEQNSSLDVIGDGCRLPFSNMSFDLVVLSQVLEHVYDPKKAIQEVYRVLRPGGVIVGGVSFLEPFHDSYFNLSHRAIEDLLSKAEFNDITIETGVTGIVLMVARVIGLSGSKNQAFFSWCGRLLFPVKYFLKAGYSGIRLKNRILKKNMTHFEKKVNDHYESVALSMAGHFLFCARRSVDQ